MSEIEFVDVEGRDMLDVRLKNGNMMLLEIEQLLDDPRFAPLREDDRIFYPHVKKDRIFWKYGPEEDYPELTLEELVTLLTADTFSRFGRGAEAHAEKQTN